MEPFEREVLELICSTCNVEDVDLDKMSSQSPILGPESPLGIDSIDALEIAVTVQQQYGVRMDSNNSTRVVMESLGSLARYIQKEGGLA